MDSWIWILVAAAVVVVLVLGAVWLGARARRRRRTAHLRARFGPEYDTAVARLGRSLGEQQLEARIDERQARRTRDVTDEERDAALRSFEAVQASFVESPVTAVRAADQLVFDVLRDRGYPLETMDVRASALSVDEPELAHRYRDAHRALARAEATTDGSDVEPLRTALLTYRDLLRELVGAPRVQGRLQTEPTEPTAPTAPSRTNEPEPQEGSWTYTPTDRT